MGNVGSGDLRQHDPDPLAVRLQEVGQLQSLAEALGRLVDGEAWVVRGDLKQDPVRLAEVDRPK